jgi:hypothetical protein
MKKKLIAALIALSVSTYFGVLIDPELVNKIIGMALTSSEAAEVVDPLQASSVSILSPLTPLVGALRPPSAYSKADRACYYCHGFHDSYTGISRTVRLAALASRPGSHVST